MSTTSKLAVTVGLIAAGALAGVGPAAATPPVATPEPGGIIRLDIPAGETWECEGWGTAPPYLQVTPDFYQLATGPTAIHLRYPPGTPVWVMCVGNGVPFYHFGPVVTTLP